MAFDTYVYFDTMHLLFIFSCRYFRMFSYSLLLLSIIELIQYNKVLMSNYDYMEVL